MPRARQALLFFPKRCVKLLLTDLGQIWQWKSAHACVLYAGGLSRHQDEKVLWSILSAADTREGVSFIQRQLTEEASGEGA